MMVKKNGVLSPISNEQVLEQLVQRTQVVSREVQMLGAGSNMVQASLATIFELLVKHTDVTHEEIEKVHETKVEEVDQEIKRINKAAVEAVEKSSSGLVDGAGNQL